MKSKSLNVRLFTALDRKSLMDEMNAYYFPLPLKINSNQFVLIISPLTIAKLVEEELIHDNEDILKQSGQTLHSMSSGERKRAFLLHCLAQKPSVLVLDHFFDNLDTEATISFETLLEEASATVTIINIYSRPADQLLFSEKILYYQNQQWLDQTPTVTAFNTNSAKIPLPKVTQHQELTTDCLVRFEDVNIKYLNKPILSNINWVVNKGEFWHLLGPNGSGKTTLLTLITGDNPKAFNQNITLFGTKKGSGESVWDIKQKVGYFTSNMTFQFKRSQTMVEMITSGFYDSVGLYNVPSDIEIKLANDWLTFLNLSELGNESFLKMSLCHQRMIMIARAMVKHPPLLILDEPTVDLDHSSAAMISDLINRISTQTDISIIYVSHRMEEGLKPSHRYRLTPHQGGSKGKSKSH